MAKIIPLKRRSTAQLSCSACGACSDAACDCGAPYLPAGDIAARAIKANPKRSDRSIAEEVGVNQKTVGASRRELGEEYSSPERIGRDGKSYSVRQRVTEDPDISPALANEAAATGRRRVFLRCAEDSFRKAEQGAGLKDAKESEIDDEILEALENVIEAWTSLRDEILNRKGE
jgi:hypothetical protein